MEIFDLQTTVALLKGMKDYQKIQFFESKDGKEFVKSLCTEFYANEEQGLAIDSLVKAIGHEGFNFKGESIEKRISLVDDMNYSPTELAMPIDHTAEMKNFPDKRLNSDHVLRSIRAKVIDPQQYWVKQSDLCHQFKASAESIEAALFREVAEGR